MHSGSVFLNYNFIRDGLKQYKCDDTKEIQQPRKKTRPQNRFHLYFGLHDIISNSSFKMIPNITLTNIELLQRIETAKKKKKKKQKKKTAFQRSKVQLLWDGGGEITIINL